LLNSPSPRSREFAAFSVAARTQEVLHSGSGNRMCEPWVICVRRGRLRTINWRTKRGPRNAPDGAGRVRQDPADTRSALRGGIPPDRKVWSRVALENRRRASSRIFRRDRGQSNRRGCLDARRLRCRHEISIRPRRHGPRQLLRARTTPSSAGWPCAAPAKRQDSASRSGGCSVLPRSAAC
jgi:hypothetical protein